MKINLSSAVIPLSQLAPGTEGSIHAVLGPGRGVQLRLALLGVRPGAPVRVVGRGPGGPLLVEVNGTRVALGRALARRILVTPRPQSET